MTSNVTKLADTSKAEASNPQAKKVYQYSPWQPANADMKGQLNIFLSSFARVYSNLSLLCSDYFDIILELREVALLCKFVIFIL